MLFARWLQVSPEARLLVFGSRLPERCSGRHFECCSHNTPRNAKLLKRRLAWNAVMVEYQYEELKDRDADLDQASANGKPHESSHVVNIQPLAELRAMSLDRLDADVEFRCNLFCAATLSYQNQDLALAGRQLLEQF